MSEQREDMTERDDLPGEVLAAADDAARSVGAEESAAPTGKYGKLLSEEGGVRKLTGMYRNWFLDYASYVILERAVPHVQDGLKPVQRRILLREPQYVRMPLQWHWGHLLKDLPE